MIREERDFDQMARRYLTDEMDDVADEMDDEEMLEFEEMGWEGDDEDLDDEDFDWDAWDLPYSNTPHTRRTADAGSRLDAASSRADAPRTGIMRP